MNNPPLIITPFGNARFLGTIGVSLRDDTTGIFDTVTGEYVIIWNKNRSTK